MIDVSAASAETLRKHIADLQRWITAATEPGRKAKLEAELAALEGDPEVTAKLGEPIDFSAIPPAAGYATLADFAAEVAYLAELPPHEYDRCRRDEAKRLGVRTATLDKAVQLARPRDEIRGGQGEDLVFEPPEPWPDPVDGAQLLDALAAFLGDHLALRPHDGAKIALWILHTFVYEAGFITPRLAITSATRRCGKSTLVDILSALCSRAITADSLTVAATFRAVAMATPTLLIDEADNFLKDNEELRGILNSGHKATGSVIRAVEVAGEWLPRKFRTFCPCAIAMIGRLPGTLEDRSVPVLMKRAMRGEVKRSFRPDRAEQLEQLRSQATRFANDHMAALAAVEPELPPGAFNRFADNWRPLVALADLVGGRWPSLARAALLADLGKAEEDELGHQLLEDMRTIFDTYVDADTKKAPAQKLASNIIVTALKEMADRPWNEIGRDARPITPNKLARMLKDFDIASSGSIRLPSGQTPKGYKREAFVEAWSRYLAPEEANATATPPQAAKTLGHSDSATATKPSDVAVAKRSKPKQTAACGGVAVAKGDLAAQKKNGAGLEPSGDWQDAPEGTVWPPGCEFRINVTTGRTEVRKPLAEVDASPDFCAACARAILPGEMSTTFRGKLYHLNCALLTPPSKRRRRTLC